MITPCGTDLSASISTPPLQQGSRFDIPNSPYSLQVTNLNCGNHTVSLSLLKNNAVIDNFSLNAYAGDSYHSSDSGNICINWGFWQCTNIPYDIDFMIYYNSNYPPGATNYLELHIKPNSWYTPGGAADKIVENMTALNGAFVNMFSGISGVTYISTTIGVNEKDVVLYVYYKDVNAGSISAQAIQITWQMIALVLAVLVGIGIIYAVYVFAVNVSNYLFGKNYSKGEVTDMFGTAFDKQMENCKTNFPTDGAGYAACVKSVLCGGFDAMGDGLDLAGVNCINQQINQNVDACSSQYAIDHDYTKLQTCLGLVKEKALVTAKDAANKSMGCLITWPFCVTSGNLLVGAAVIGAVIIGAGYLSEDKTVRKYAGYAGKTTSMVKRGASKIKRRPSGA